MSRVLVPLALMILALSGCEDGVYSGTVIFSGEHEYGDDASLEGDVYIRASSVEFGQGSRVAGSIYVLGGLVTVDGRIAGDLVVMGGTVTLGPDAVVEGDLRSGSGSVSPFEPGQVHGETVADGPAFPVLSEGRVGLHGAFRSLAIAVILALIAALLRSRLAGPLVRVSAAAAQHPFVAGSLGLLGLLVIPALLIMMAFTVVLIPVVAVLAILLLLGLAYGLAAVGMLVGERLTARLRRTWPPPAAAFVGTLMLGICFAIPYLGGVLMLISAVVAGGALLLTRFGVQSYRMPEYLNGDGEESYRRQ